MDAEKFKRLNTDVDKAYAVWRSDPASTNKQQEYESKKRLVAELTKAMKESFIPKSGQPKATFLE